MNTIDLLITLTQNEKDANNVTLAFSMGVQALKKGHKVELILLSHAVHLAEEGYGDTIDIGEPFKPVKELIPAYLELGGVLKVCKACMIHNGVNEDRLIAGSQVIQADDVIDTLMAAEKSLQLN